MRILVGLSILSILGVSCSSNADLEANAQQLAKLQCKRYAFEQQVMQNVNGPYMDSLQNLQVEIDSLQNVVILAYQKDTTQRKAFSTAYKAEFDKCVEKLRRM